MVGEHALYNFNSQNFWKTCFIAQSTIHFGKKKSPCALEKNESPAIVQDCLLGVSKVNFVICYFLFSHELFVCLLSHVFSTDSLLIGLQIFLFLLLFFALYVLKLYY